MTDGAFRVTWHEDSGVVYPIWWTDDFPGGWPSGQWDTPTGGFWDDTNQTLQQ